MVGNNTIGVLNLTQHEMERVPPQNAKARRLSPKPFVGKAHFVPIVIRRGDDVFDEKNGGTANDFCVGHRDSFLEVLFRNRLPTIITGGGTKMSTSSKTFNSYFNTLPVKK